MKETIRIQFIYYYKIRRIELRKKYRKEERKKVVQNGGNEEDGRRTEEEEERRKRRRRMNVDYNLIKKMFNFKLYRNNKEGRNNKISNHYRRRPWRTPLPGGQVDRPTPPPPPAGSIIIIINGWMDDDGRRRKKKRKKKNRDT